MLANALLVGGTMECQRSDKLIRNALAVTTASINVLVNNITIYN